MVGRGERAMDQMDWMVALAGFGTSNTAIRPKCHLGAALPYPPVEVADRGVQDATGGTG